MTTPAELPNESAVTNSRGLTLFVDMSDKRARDLSDAAGILNADSHALWSVAVNLREWDIVVDVGANYGEMLANVDLSRVGRIVAFEPNPHVATYLRKTISGLPWKVRLEEQAVSSVSAETVDLAVTPGWSGKTTLSKNVSALDGEDYVVLPGISVTTLDEQLADENLSSACIKIDVEGEELGVLAGTERLLDELGVAVCMVEILHMPVQTIARLAHRYPLFLWQVDTQRLVRVFGNDVNNLGQLLHDGRHSRQDALILGGRDRDQLATQIRRQFPEPELPRRVVYTALLGNYERLQEQPVAAQSDIDFICLTDNPSLTSQTWQIRLVNPLYPLDMVRSARHLKISGHPVLRGFDETLWVDNRVQLLKDPAQILDDLLAEHDVALFEHSFRDRVVDEFDAVVAGGYDDFHRVYEQLLHYAESAPHLLDEKPLWTGFLARRATPAVDASMESWLHHVLRYSRRDQLSVNYALGDDGIRVARLEGSNRESKYHRWPPLNEALGRRGRGGRSGYEHSIRAPLARLRAVEREHIDTVEAHRLSAVKREEIIRTQQEAIKGHNREIKATIDAQSKKHSARIADLQARLRREEQHVASMRRRAAVSKRTIERQLAQIQRLQKRVQQLRERNEKIRAKKRRIEKSLERRRTSPVRRLKRRLTRLRHRSAVPGKADQRAGRRE